MKTQKSQSQKSLKANDIVSFNDIRDKVGETKKSAITNGEIVSSPAFLDTLSSGTSSNKIPNGVNHDHWKQAYASGMAKGLAKRRVVLILGEFEKGDFVLEPTCSDDCMCEECKNAFWITKVLESKK